jgi:hypothetical protein
MKKNILFILFVGAIVWAGQLTYTTTQVENAVAVIEGDASINSLTFTNGWAISCTSTSLVFVAP